MSDASVQVLHILGQAYSIRAPEDEQHLLKLAEQMLQQRLAECEERYPTARSHELLALTALNLCVPLCSHEQQVKQLELRLDALRGQISSQLIDP